MNLFDALGLFSFLNHYYFGGGTPVDLADVGLLDAFKMAANWSVNYMFKMKTDNYAKHLANSMCSSCSNGSKVKTFRLRDSDRIDSTWEPGLSAVGHSSLSRTANCKIFVNCTNRSFSYSCSRKFSIRDSFKDPLDIGIEAGGTIYMINANWQDTHNGHGSF